MNNKGMPNPRLEPLPASHSPELAAVFETSRKNLGFIPNSFLIMQRRPKIVQGFAALSAAVWAADGEVDRGFKRLLAFVASRASGCLYCMAHTGGGALIFGVDEAKVADVWNYRSSPHYSEAERVALDVALAAASVPNDVTDELFARLREHWSEGQIVEIVALISMFGFLNRFNDTMATPLEDEPIEFGEKFLAGQGWTPGKHAR